MKDELNKWDELYIDALAADPDFNMEIPVDLLPDEDEASAFMRYFKEVGVLKGDSEGLEVDLELAEELDPNYRKFFEALINAANQAMLESLEKQGYIYMAVSEEGEIEYVVTEEGKDVFGLSY